MRIFGGPRGKEAREKEARKAGEAIVAVRFQWEPDLYVRKPVHGTTIPRVGEKVTLHCRGIRLEGTAAEVRWRFFDREPEWEYLDDGEGTGTFGRAGANIIVMLQEMLQAPWTAQRAARAVECAGRNASPGRKSMSSRETREGQLERIMELRQSLLDDPPQGEHQDAPRWQELSRLIDQAEERDAHD